MDLRRASSMVTAASYLQWWVEGRTRRLGPTPWVMLPAPEPHESGPPPREPRGAAVPHPSSRRRREERELPSRAGRGRIRQGEPGIRAYGGGSASSRGRAVHDGRRRGWRREEVTTDLAHRRPVAACRRGVEHPAGG